MEHEKIDSITKNSNREILFLAVLLGRGACTSTSNPFISDLGEVSVNWQRLCPSCTVLDKKTN